MKAYRLAQEDIADLWALIAGANLTLTANNAQRVAQLQTLLKEIEPEECVAPAELAAALEVKEKECKACIVARDAALIEAGVAKRRIAELEHQAKCADPLCCTANYERKCAQLGVNPLLHSGYMRGMSIVEGKEQDTQQACQHNNNE